MGANMRTKDLFSCVLAGASCLFLFACTVAHAQPSASTEKLENIRKLIVLLGGLDMPKQILNEVFASLREKAPQPGSEYEESKTKEVDEKELQELIDKLVPVYDKYLTDDDVSELLKFYDSPTGKRVAQVMPRIREESTRITLEWRQSLANNETNKRGGLIRAVAKGDTAVVEQLLSNGVDVNQRNSRGITPLMAAAYKGNVELTKLFVEKGADVNARSNKGGTPLMAAVQSGNKELVKFLLDSGADANAQDQMGLNAFHFAAMKDQQELMALLKDKIKDNRAVGMSLVVSSLGKGKDCLPVMSLPSDSSQEIACVKLGQEVVTVPGVPVNNGWTLIQLPKVGWVRSEFLKQSLMVKEPQRKMPAKPRKSVASNTHIARVRLSTGSTAPMETQVTETATKSTDTDQPRIWWRHN